MWTARPPCGAHPDLDCLLKNLDAGRCAEFVWRLTSHNDEGDIDTFFIDVEAGEGGRDPACIGSVAGAEAMVPPPGWSVTNCTGWNSGHALFRFVADTPADAIPPGGSATGFVTVDTNKSREYERTPFGTQPAATIPPFTVLMTPAQIVCNEPFATCESNDYRFGPRQGGPQYWGAIRHCEAPLNAPALSTWAKVVLAAVLLAGGALLVLRSRSITAT